MKTIRQMTQQFTVTSRTLRYYEELGLLHPTRQGNRRLFSQQDEAKMKLIMRGKQFGFSLEEIKEMVLLFDYDRSGIAQLERTIAYGEQKITDVTQQIEELEQLRADLHNTKAAFEQKLYRLKEESS